MSTKRTGCLPYRPELSADAPFAGPRAIFTDEAAMRAADSSPVTVLPLIKPRRKRHVKRGGRPSRRDRGLK
ncbi:hypothetical protein [Paraburkholderia heleia]|uniref:hypothetical protein n=1 Tax=Paraburkholderia heleia TaxID=634127 RepID=UPI0012EE761B|nr:hypothetical protein [Paraburkholderia heleia]